VANVQANPDGTPFSGVTLRRGKHIGPLFIEPFDGWKFKVPPGEPAKVEFTVTVEREPLNILRVEGAEPDFQARLETLKAGKSYRIVVQALPKTDPGRYTSQLRVITDNALLPYFRIRLVAAVEPSR